MTNKRTLWINVGMMLAFGLVLTGCASLRNLFNSIHAINSNGEKVEAAWGSGKTVKIEGTEYEYADRPAVPPAPQKPKEPQKPNPPEPIRFKVDTGGGPGVGPFYTEESFSSVEEAERRLDYYRSEELGQHDAPGSVNIYKKHLRDVVNTLTSAITLGKSMRKQYDSALAQYQANFSKYQQDLAKYDKDIAEYQAKLPQYTAAAEAEAKRIQGGINSSAPGDWVGYVKDKYLLYKGK